MHCLRLTLSITIALTLLCTGCNFPSLIPDNDDIISEIADSNETGVEFSKATKQKTTNKQYTRQESNDPCLIYADELDSFEIPDATEIWPRMRNGFSFGQYNNDRVTQQLKKYAKSPHHIDAVTQRGELYLHFILEKLDERKLPYELAIIPMIESGFDPFAYSYATASGLWQFMPYTGKHLGLDQNWWYDGRRDVPASTEAALNYLSQLYSTFDNDWLLALAAYNGGQGNVRKAIKKNKQKGKPTDFWSLDLPPQTELYIPKILAFKRIILNPDNYGIELPAIADAPYFALADIGGQLDLAQAAKLADVEIDEIYQLNPGFNRWATSPDGPHCLVIPATKYDGFVEALRALPKEQRVTWERYKIKPGDALSKIAKKYNTTTTLLSDINQLNGVNIRAGKTLLVPRASEENHFYVLSSAERLKAKQANGKGLRMQYIVQSGDSLWTIAKQYKTTSSQIATWNNMAPRDTLRIGQKLVIWDKSAASKGETRKIRYTVKQGDSLARIADKFGVTIQKIENWNGINRKDILRPGKKLTVHVNITEARS